MVITGDANACTSNLPDYVEIDQFLFKEVLGEVIQVGVYNNTLPQESKVRNSTCNKINKVGRKLLDICKTNNLLIVNGRLNPDITGKKTFRGVSLIDYTICTQSLFSSFKHFEVTELDPLFSDGHN